MKFEKDETLFTGRLKSIGFAVKGAIKLITTEHSVMVQSSLAVLMTFAGFYVGINRFEWMMQILVFGLVLGIEGLNTAVEKIADFVHPDLRYSRWCCIFCCLNCYRYWLHYLFSIFVLISLLL